MHRLPLHPPPRHHLPLLPAVLLMLAAQPSAAQTLEVSPFIAYRVGGEFSGFSVKDNASYGGTLSYDVGPGFGAEFLFSHQGSDIVTDPGQVFRASVNINEWALLGWRSFGRPGSRVHPFGNAGIGLSDLSASGGGGSSTRVAAVFGVGTKVFATPNVGLRFDARGYLTFVNSSGGFFCSTGGGCGVGFSSSAFFQMDFGGGVFIALGRRRTAPPR